MSCLNPRLLWALAIVLPLWGTVASAASGVLLVSEIGDGIGAGKTQQLAITESSADPALLTVASGTRFVAQFDLPRGAAFEAGRDFAGATRYPSNSPTLPGLTVGLDGRACNRLIGWFEVREAQFSSAGEIVRLAIDFKQRCEGASGSLYGAVRINSTLPLEIPAVGAIAGPSQFVMGRDTVILDGGLSFSQGAATVEWTQVSGTRVTMRGDTRPVMEFTAPLAPPGGEDLVFQLRVSAGGASDASNVVVHVGTKTDPQTYLQLRSDSGDWVGGGGAFRFTPLEGDITVRTNYRGGVSSYFNGNTYYSFDFAPASGQPFGVGSYENAQRFTVAAADSPGMDVSGDGRSCSSIAGRFDVLQLMTDDAGNITRLAVDYEQHCNQGVPALRGEVRWNYLESGAPVAVAGSDQTVIAGSNVVLDGTGSTDDAAVVEYSWRQAGGPTAALTGADTSRATFVAPSVSSSQTIDLQLVVADDRDLTAVDTIHITVNPSPDAPPPSPPPPTGDTGGSGNGAGGGGANSMLFVLPGALLALVRQRRLIRKR